MLITFFHFSIAVNTNSGRSVGSIADLDPVNNFYGSLACPPNAQYESRMMPPPKQDLSKSGVSNAVDWLFWYTSWTISVLPAAPVMHDLGGLGLRVSK